MSKNKLKSLIQTSVNKALKSGEKEKTTTLRMSLSAIQKEEINKKSELTEEETILIIQKMIKQSKESSIQFEAAGRKERRDLPPVGRCRRRVSRTAGRDVQKRRPVAGAHDQPDPPRL